MNDAQWLIFFSAWFASYFVVIGGGIFIFKHWNKNNE